MREVRSRIACLHRPRDRSNCRSGSAVDDADLRVLCLEPCCERRLVGKGRGLAPGCLDSELVHRRIGAGLGFRQYTDERTVADDGDDARQCADLRLVEVDQRRVRRRRPQHPAVQHLRQFQIVNEAWLTEDLVRQIEAGNGFTDDAVRVRRLGGHLRGRIAVEKVVGGERPITRPRAAHAHDIAVVDDERLDRFAQPRRCGGEIDRPGFGTRMS